MLQLVDVFDDQVVVYEEFVLHVLFDVLEENWEVLEVVPQDGELVVLVSEVDELSESC